MYCNKQAGLIQRYQFCRRLIALANSLDSDQDRRSVGSDLDPNR